MLRFELFTFKNRGVLYTLLLWVKMIAIKTRLYVGLKGILSDEKQKTSGSYF